MRAPPSPTFASALFFLLLGACSGGNEGPEGVALLPGMEAVRIEDPATHWSEARGFRLMELPIHLPTTPDGRTRIEVYLRLPEEPPLEVELVEGVPRLVYPAGTIADRVESWDADPGPGEAWTVLDVRGARITEEGQRFHVLRPARAGRGAPLFGWEWRRGDAAANARAHEGIARAMRAGRGGFFAEPRDRDAATERFLGLARCDACHQRNRPTSLRSSEIDRAGIFFANRGTDAAGFYSVPAVLEDRLPLETYRPRDRNHEDPWVTLACERGAPRRVEGRGGSLRYRCDDGSLPTGARDIEGGLRAGDAKTRALCAARRFLYDHLRRSDRRSFQRAFEACRLSETGPERGEGR